MCLATEDNERVVRRDYQKVSTGMNGEKSQQTIRSTMQDSRKGTDLQASVEQHTCY